MKLLSFSFSAELLLIVVETREGGSVVPFRLDSERSAAPDTRDAPDASPAAP